MGQTLRGDALARSRAAALGAAAALALVTASGLSLRAAGGGPLAVDRWWHDLAGLDPGAPALGLALLLHHLGGRTGAALCIAAAALAFLVARRPGAIGAAGAIATAGLLGVTASNVLKALVARARPEDALVSEHSFSYPSGHSMGAAALAVSVVLALAGAERVSRGAVRWAAGGAGAWILAMMWSRTALNAHWLSDTVAGALLGVSAAVLAWVLWSALAPYLARPPRAGAAPTRPPFEGNDRMDTTPLAQPELRGPLVKLRDPRESDLDPLAAVLAEPEVAFWWVGYTPERVREELIDDPRTVRIIEVEDQCVGALVVLRGDDPEYPTTVMHIFISTAFRGRRIGEEALALAIRHEFDEGIARVTLDPNVHNAGAIRSYERMGFRRVGILRDYQVRPGGALEDALFLDLTRTDFPEGPPLPERPAGPAAPSAV